MTANMGAGLPDERPTVASVNVGSLRSFAVGDHTVTTGFFKKPVNEPVIARRLGLEGDVQADRTVHGGVDKAVYLYPYEHYAPWQVLLGTELQPGSFGENVTSVGLVEEDVFIGDVFQCGSAVLQAIQPRSPCYKLQLRFKRYDMTALFAQQGWPGWYASVLQEGTVAAHDQIVRLERVQDRISIADVWRYSFVENADPEAASYVAKLAMLPDFWKHRILR